MKNKMIKASILPAILLPIVLMVGCSNSKEEQQVILLENIDEQTQMEEVNEGNKNTTEGKGLVDKEIDSVFSGVWVHVNEEQDVNIYLKIREDRCEYQTNKECYLTYEGVENVHIDKDNKKITLNLITHDEQEFKTYIEIVDINTIIVRSTEDVEGVKYTKVINKEDAAEDLAEVWEDTFGVYEGEDRYLIEEFLELEK